MSHQPLPVLLIYAPSVSSYKRLILEGVQRLTADMSHSSATLKSFSVCAYAIWGEHVAPSLSLRGMDSDLLPLHNKADSETGGNCAGDTNNTTGPL